MIHRPALERLHIIEALRGLAALSVAWFHLTNTYTPGWVSSSGIHGWLGVEVFFVISGFIIPYSIAATYPAYSLAQFPRFAVRRIVRLEPPYLVSIALTVVLAHVTYWVTAGNGGDPPRDLLQLLAHVAYLIPLTGNDWLQPVYWTLAYEFAFYLFIGVAFPYLCPDERWPVLAAVTIGLCVLVFAGWLPDRSLLFAIGLVTYKAATSKQEKAPMAMAMLFVGCTLVLAASNPLIATVGASAAAMIFLLRAYRLGGPIGKSLLWLGSISYSLYLTHVPIGGRVVNLGKRVIDGWVLEFALSITALIISLAFAQLFLWCVERPAVRWARRVDIHSRTSPPVPAP